MAKRDRKLDALHRKSAKQLRRFSANSAAAMQSKVAASMTQIVNAAATGGEAAGLRALRSAVNAARAQYQSKISTGAARAAARTISADVQVFAEGKFAASVRGAKGTTAAKRAMLAKTSKAPLGRAGVAWERQMVGSARAWGAADSGALFSKLKRVVKSAAKAKVSRAVLTKLARSGRQVVTKQAQISSRRAINTAVDRVGSLRSVADKAIAKSGGLKAYTWRTVGDDLVREEHEARDGKDFKFAQPPPDGNPGEPPNCRCSAELIVEL